MFAETLALTSLGVVLGGALGVAARKFAVTDENPLIKEVEALLPGGQCGQCALPGCTAAAAAMVEGTAKITCCPPGGVALAEKLSRLLDIPLDASGMAAPKIARIDAGQCIGCTKCYRVCPTDAIVGASGQIHVVLQGACTGCGKCEAVCPEDCLTMVEEGLTLDNWRWAKPDAA